MSSGLRAALGLVLAVTACGAPSPAARLDGARRDDGAMSTARDTREELVDDGATTDEGTADEDTLALDDSVDEGASLDARHDEGALDARAEAAPLDATARDAASDAGRDADSLDATARDAASDARADGPRDGAASDATMVVSACPSDMVAQPGFCIDRYEAPNERGAAPLAMQTALDGARWCEARGRRLCTEAEWVRACQGASGRRFPYGNTYARGRCVDDKVWRAPNWTTLGSWPSTAAMNEARRLYQAEPSGSRAGCASEDGVIDLAGNVAEWVVRSFANANNYDHVMRGCYWAGCYGGAPPSCTFVNPAHPGSFRTYEAGFRCCVTRAP